VKTKKWEGTDTVVDSGTYVKYTMVGRVDNPYVWRGWQSENQGGQTKKIFPELCSDFYQTYVCPPSATLA